MFIKLIEGFILYTKLMVDEEHSIIISLSELKEAFYTHRFSKGSFITKRDINKRGPTYIRHYCLECKVVLFYKKTKNLKSTDSISFFYPRETPIICSEYLNFLNLPVFLKHEIIDMTFYRHQIQKLNFLEILKRCGFSKSNKLHKTIFRQAYYEIFDGRTF